MDTQTQIDRLIELAIIQRSELKQLVEQLPQLREHLNAEVEKVFEETEPQLRSELEEFCEKRAADANAKVGTALETRIASLAADLQVSTQARFDVLKEQERKLEALRADAKQEIAAQVATMPEAVKEIVTAELARFPRAGEIDQLRKEFAEPKSLNPRGKWLPSETYNKLDLVTFNGDSYVSNTDGNRERPSRNAANWTLSAARGMGGGTGFTSLNNVLGDPSAGQIVGSEGGQYVRKTLVAGANITINETASTITIIGDEGQISLQDGTAAAPALFFTNDTDTGIYRPAANTLGISVSGTQVAYFDANGLTVPSAGVVAGGSIHAANGNANNPSLSFSGDQDTGFFRHQPNELGITLGGVQKATLTSTTFTITPNLVVSGTGSINGTSIPASKTLVVTTDKLSALASTSSSELAGVISDETGTGALVFANTPTLVTPNIGAATGTSVNLSGNATVGGTLTVSGNASLSSGLMVGSSGYSPTVPLIGIYRAATSVPVVYSALNNSYGWSWGLDGSSNYVVTENGGLGLGTTRMTIAPGGNATLAGNLTVSGTGLSSVAGSLAVAGQVSSPANSTLVMDFAGGADQGRLLAKNSAGTYTTPILVVNPLTTSGNLTVSGTGNSSVAGNLGLGTTSPSKSGSSRTAFTMNAPTGQLSILELCINESLAAYAYANASQFTFSAQPSRFMSFETGGVETARLTSTGNLLLGTTTDSGVKLQVQGGVKVIDSGNNSNYITIGSGNDAPAGGNSFIAQTGTLVVGTAAAASLILRTGGSTALTLDSSQAAQFFGKVTITPEANADSYFGYGSTLDTYLTAKSTGTHNLRDSTGQNWWTFDRNKTFIVNTTSAPSGNPSGGGYLYVEGGALKYRGSSGTVTTIANA